MTVDLKSLQERLNQDRSALDEFLADPVTVLAREGLVLSEAEAQEVTALAADARSRLAAPGSSVGAPTPSMVQIKISIPI